MRHALVPFTLYTLLTACAVPAKKIETVGLEPPVPSAPAHFSVDERIKYWEKLLPSLDSADKGEAYLQIAQLQLSIRKSFDARVNFYTALQSGVRLSRLEVGKAKMGIGLSYVLDGNVPLGLQHLKDARENLDLELLAETEYLIGAIEGDQNSYKNEEIAKRMSPYLQAANINQPLKASFAGNRQLIDVQREKWGAARIKSNWDRMNSPWRITIHHTAEPFSATSLSASITEIKDIQNQHMNENGWADIGYHFLIDRGGTVFEGRPLYAQGAHASGSNNVGNIGICLLGNFVAQPNRGLSYSTPQSPTKEQLSALKRTINNLRKEYSIKPSDIYSHKEFKNTQCPGPALSAWVRDYREKN